jgi:hypothetical protein
MGGNSMASTPACDRLPPERFLPGRFLVKDDWLANLPVRIEKKDQKEDTCLFIVATTAKLNGMDETLLTRSEPAKRDFEAA